MRLALDGFKSVDDVHGHTPGDRVLAEAAAEPVAAQDRGGGPSRVGPAASCKAGALLTANAGRARCRPDR